jgi:Fe-S-cluster containining protein
MARGNIVGRDVRILPFHATYRCRDSGVCCTSNWPIPVEADRLGVLTAALSTGGLRPVASAVLVPLQLLPDAPAETPALVAAHDGRCVFHDPAGSCAIHKALGHSALPLACRQFPRVTVADPRGVSVTLSHYCPTAAGLLRDATAVDEYRLLVNPPAFPPDAEYVGLDASTALPPLLRPDILMDWESWWEVERLGVETLLREGHSAADAVRRVRGAVARLLEWSPGRGELFDLARHAFDGPPARKSTDPAQLIANAIAAVPLAYRRQTAWASTTCTDDAVSRRFLAAHAFANWSVHTGDGLTSWLRSIETAAAFLEAGAGVSHTDLVLRHLIGNDGNDENEREVSERRE